MLKSDGPIRMVHIDTDDHTYLTAAIHISSAAVVSIRGPYAGRFSGRKKVLKSSKLFCGWVRMGHPHSHTYLYVFIRIDTYLYLFIPIHTYL